MASCDGRAALTVTYGKRLAEGLDDSRTHKRAKDSSVLSTAHVEVGPPQPLLSTALRSKRGHEDVDAADGRVSAATGKGGGEGQRVLQVSELENSITTITAALRWRSPAKPHKLPRLHGPDYPPGRPTAVRGIVDVGADDDDDTEPAAGGGAAAHDQRRQHPQAQAPQASERAEPPHQQRQSRELHERGHCERDGAATRSSVQPARLPPQQPEWGQLFTALSLGGGGRGSQRTDPVWAALGNNRAGCGSGAARRGITLAGHDHSTTAAGPARAPGGAAASQAGPHSRSAPALDGHCASGGGGGDGCSGAPVHTLQPAADAAPRPMAGTAVQSKPQVGSADAMDADERFGAAAAQHTTNAAPAADKPVSVVWSQGQQAFAVVCSAGAVACSAAMDASPVRGLACGVAGETGEGLERAAERPVGRSAFRGSSGGGFLAQEAGRLMASFAK